MTPIRNVVQQGLERGIPAIQAVVLHRGDPVVDLAVGEHDGGTVAPTTRFDAASLTKLVATTAVVAVLRSQRVFDLDDPVADALPSFAANGKAQVTVRQLLAHASGLPAWRPFFVAAMADPVGSAIYPWSETHGAVARALAFDRSRQLVLDSALRLPLEQPGVRTYSDVGFIALGEWLTAVTGEPLDALCQRLVFEPCAAHRTGFFDLRSAPFSVDPLVATGASRPRPPAPGQEDAFTVRPHASGHDLGCVDDDNAYAMAGVAGHAGVFSTATDIAAIAQVLLDDFYGAGHIADADVLREFFAPDASAAGASRGLGVDRISPSGSTAGSRFGQAGPLGGVGHLGFTGCSLWIDLDRRAVAALLTNRVLPGREQTEAIRWLRPAFHDAAAARIDGGPAIDEPTDPGSPRM